MTRALIALTITTGIASTNATALSEELAVHFVDWTVDLPSFEVIDADVGAIATGEWRAHQTGRGTLHLENVDGVAVAEIEMSLEFPSLENETPIRALGRFTGPFRLAGDGLTGWVGVAAALSGTIRIDRPSSRLHETEVDVHLYLLQPGSIIERDEPPAPFPPAEFDVPELSPGFFEMPIDPLPRVPEFAPFGETTISARVRVPGRPEGQFVRGSGHFESYPRFTRGDVDDNGEIELADAVRSLDFLFRGRGRVWCLDAADADDDGELGLTDPIFTLSFLFLGGLPPQDPHDECGVDWTPDELECKPSTRCQVPGE